MAGRESVGMPLYVIALLTHLQLWGWTTISWVLLGIVLLGTLVSLASGFIGRG